MSPNVSSILFLQVNSKQFLRIPKRQLVKSPAYQGVVKIKCTRGHFVNDEAGQEIMIKKSEEVMG